MYCENCGKKIPDGSQFCPECGAPVRKTKVQKNPVNRQVKNAKTLNIGGKAVDRKTAISAVIAIVGIILMIAVPLGIQNHNMSSRFEKAGREMQYDWPKSEATSLKVTDQNQLINDFSDDMEHMGVQKLKSVDYYQIRKSDEIIGRFVLYQFDSSSDCDRAMSYIEMDDIDGHYDKTGTGYIYDDRGVYLRYDKKGSFILWSDYDSDISSLSEKFISKVGF